MGMKRPHDSSLTVPPLVLQLRVFGPAPAMGAVADRLSRLPGATHLTLSGCGDGSGSAVVTADLQPEAADAALQHLDRLGVPAADRSLLRLDAIDRGMEIGEGLVWADLVGQAAAHSRPVVRYLVFMAAAGVIAAYGVIYSNGILIVGAMAVSPDLLPITAVCVGLVLARARLVRRALWTLAAGLGAACAIAAALTAGLDALGLLPSSFQVGEGALHGLVTVNSSTVVVALVAGVVGMLSLETRASAAVGVAISVTTIPASAYLGVAVGVGEVDKASGALLVLGINVAALITGGTLTLAVQRRLQPRHPQRTPHASPGSSP
jgi:uncharacterized hydrophobic protein (TIGR00271 family)